MNKPFRTIPAWKTAPFIRLLIPLITGIVLQWHIQIDLAPIALALTCFAVAYSACFLLPLRLRYRWQWLQGGLLNLLLVAVAAFVTYQKDIRHGSQWFGHTYHDSDYLIVRINEPLTEKAKSFKAEAVIESLVNNDSSHAVKGKLLLYFAKDSSMPNLQYGDRILLNKPLQRIQNMGNPGSFNYERYAAFQQLFHNAFVKTTDYVVLSDKAPNTFWQWIYRTKAHVLSVLRKHIATKDERGIAEALLIGYKEDLDKDLVQAYSNTGVVHIIAISGLHLGIIYMLLLGLFNRLPMVNKSKWIKALGILAGLWFFALITGASASVMFSFMVLGEQAGKKSSMYNALAVSATLLLVYNPYLLWDVGFQLSYLAVVGIVAFQKPIYNWWYIQNKWADKVWKLTAVSLAAQLLTFPVCIYYFHQFPMLFLVANLIAVPLSSLILLAELLLVALAWVPSVGIYLGKAITGLLWCMNAVIRWINGLPMALWDAIPATLLTTWLLYAAVMGTCYWLLYKKKTWLYLALGSMAAFAIVQVYTKWQVYGQCKMIVYNVPQRQAIDFVQGSAYHFVGDSSLQLAGLLQNFHLKPSRISLQLTQPSLQLPALQMQGRQFVLGNKKIIIIDSSLLFEPPAQKIKADVIVLSGNPKLRIPQLAAVFDCSQYVFDAANSLWKINYWKKDCEQLLLRCHSVAEQGAFILDAE
jgi:competence protein ComEC